MKFKGEIPTEMQSLIIDYCGKLGVDHNELKVVREKRDSTFNGFYNNKVITFNELVFKTWAEEDNRQMSKFLIAHELTHAKYNECGKIISLLSLVVPTLALHFAFRELRANVGACQLTKSTAVDLKKYFNPEGEKGKYNYYPEIFKTDSALSGGYIDGKLNYDFIVANNEWKQDTASNAREMIRGYAKRFKWIPLSWYKKIEKKYSISLLGF
ncbi:hypothetical protein [Rummeliibacillus pycnus]|uniref:hypothetical protein n=1 Tax=Rummeliibacillus pycnus TaxID=101070 RepID=UPI003D27FFB2